MNNDDAVHEAAHGGTRNPAWRDSRNVVAVWFIAIVAIMCLVVNIL